MTNTKFTFKDPYLGVGGFNFSVTLTGDAENDVKMRLATLKPKSSFNRGVAKYALEIFTRLCSIWACDMLNVFERPITQWDLLNLYAYGLEFKEVADCTDKHQILDFWLDICHGNHEAPRDIANALCTKQELKRTRHGELPYNKYDTWYEFQALAYETAGYLVCGLVNKVSDVLKAKNSDAPTIRGRRPI